MSGAPVWSEQAHCVIGIVADHYVSEDNVDVALAFAVPIEEIVTQQGENGQAVGLCFVKTSRPRNPFTPGIIHSPEQFVGRQTLLAQLLQLIQQGQSVALLGGPQTGKSSLLGRVHDSFRSQGAWKTVLLDMKRITSNTHFFEWLALELLGKRVTAAELDHYLDRVQLLLCIDDYHTLENLRNRDKLALYLRGLGQAASLRAIPPKVIVVASLIAMHQLYPAHEYERKSDPGTIFTEIALPDFTLEDARQLAITYLEGTGVQFSPDEVERCYQQGSKTPYRLQEAFRNLFETKIR